MGSKWGVDQATGRLYQLYTAIKAETAKAFEIVELYEFAKSFLPDLNISKNAIRYYADLAEQYAAYRLRRLSKPQQWLQALCFVYYRHQQIMDNLITSFIFHTRAIITDGKIHAEKAMAEHSSNLVVDLPKVANFLKWFPNRKRDLSHDELNHEAYNILPEEQYIYEKMLEEGVSQDIIDEFLQISPIAWVHIAFTGKYSFKKSNGNIDITSMVDAMEKHLKQHFWKSTTAAANANLA